MVGEALTIEPPILVNDNPYMEEGGDVSCYRSAAEACHHFEYWFAEEKHFVVDSRGQMMKFFALANDRLELRGIGGPSRPDLFRRYLLHAMYYDDPATMAKKDSELSDDDVRRLAMEWAERDAREYENASIGSFFTDGIRALWLWITRRG